MKEYLGNIRDNFLFVISAAAFAILNNSGDLCGILTVSLSVIATLIVAAYKPHILGSCLKGHKFSIVLAIMAAIGICEVNRTELYYCLLRNGWSFFSVDVVANADIYATVVAIIAIYFVFLMVAMFYEKAIDILKTYFSDITKVDLVAMGIISLVIVAMVFFAYKSSNAFYGVPMPVDQNGVEILYDIIYSTDSPSLVKDNVYLWATHHANDIRQPFFGLFAAPFVGPLYFLSIPFKGINFVAPFMMQMVQVFLMIFAYYMIAKMLKLSQKIRVVFLAIAASTYMVLLFSLAMEQYIFGFFWLVACIFIAIETKEERVIPFTGAFGSLMTSAVLFPLLSDECVLKDWKKWFKDMFSALAKVIFMFLFLGRFDVIYSAISRLTYLSEFTGQSLTLKDRLWQYWAFVQNCFVTPNSVFDNVTRGHISWQLNWITEVYWVGVVLFICCVIGFVLNRKDRFTQISFAWMLFSLVVLVLIGWGTIENCLLLYSLYFGWAFVVLLYKLLETIIKEKALPYVLMAIAVIILFINIPGIKQVLDFATTNYPI